MDVIYFVIYGILSITEI